MITKELENMLEALPSFLKMIASASNPLIPSTTNRTGLETVTKAVWFLVPFHFLGFLGLVPLKESNIAVVLVVAFLTLVMLSWVGSVFGVITSKLLGFDEPHQAGAVSNWAVALIVTWFFCVVILTVINIALWWRFDLGYEVWPDTLEYLEYFLVNTALSEFEEILVAVIVPVISAALLLLFFTGEGAGTGLQRVAVFALCAAMCCLMVFFSIRVLEPVTRLDALSAEAIAPGG